MPGTTQGDRTYVAAGVESQKKKNGSRHSIPLRSKKMQESKNTVHFPSGSYVTIKSAFFIRLTVF
jgi:hypothetical protein